jgi:hypothetical protein
VEVNRKCLVFLIELQCSSSSEFKLAKITWHHRMFIIKLGLFLALLSIQCIRGAEFYISASNGFDSGPCGKLEPCTCLQSVLDVYLEQFNASEPLIVNVAPGTYNGTTNNNLVLPSFNNTLRAWNTTSENTVTWNGQGFSICLQSSSDIYIQGIWITGCEIGVLQGSGPENALVLENVTISTVQEFSIITQGSSMYLTQVLTTDGSIQANNSRYLLVMIADSMLSSGVLSFNSTDVLNVTISRSDINGSVIIGDPLYSEDPPQNVFVLLEDSTFTGGETSVIIQNGGSAVLRNVFINGNNSETGFYMQNGESFIGTNVTVEGYCLISIYVFTLANTSSSFQLSNSSLTHGGTTVMAASILIEDCTFHNQTSFPVIGYPPNNITEEESIRFQLNRCMFNNSDNWSDFAGVTYSTQESLLISGAIADCQFYGFQNAFTFSTGSWTLDRVVVSGVPILLAFEEPVLVSLVTFNTWEGNFEPTTLTINNSSFENNPYAIYAVNMSSVVVDSCRFYNLSTGVFANNTSNVTVSNSFFSTIFPGPVDSIGGATSFSNVGRIEISNCTFQDTSGQAGGAIYSFADASINTTMNVSSSIFSSNNQSGIYICGANATVNVDNLQFTNNVPYAVECANDGTYQQTIAFVNEESVEVDGSYDANSVIPAISGACNVQGAPVMNSNSVPEGSESQNSPINDSNVWIIVGVVIGCIVLVAVLAAGIFWFRQRAHNTYSNIQ